MCTLTHAFDSLLHLPRTAGEISYLFLKEQRARCVNVHSAPYLYSFPAACLSGLELHRPGGAGVLAPYHNQFRWADAGIFQ